MEITKILQHLICFLSFIFYIIFQKWWACFLFIKKLSLATLFSIFLHQWAPSRISYFRCDINIWFLFSKMIALYVPKFFLTRSSRSCFNLILIFYWMNDLIQEHFMFPCLSIFWISSWKCYYDQQMFLEWSPYLWSTHQSKRKNIFHVTLFANPKTESQFELPPVQTLKNRLPDNWYIWKDISLTITVGFIILKKCLKPHPEVLNKF
jgi:hypothetical protein